MFFCEPVAAGLPDAGEGWCCVGAAEYGPDRCTCWTVEHDREQLPARPWSEVFPRPGPVVEAQASPCVDCAYRANSPERRGEPGYGDPDLDELAGGGDPFWCHQGMRRVLRRRHPAGVVVEGHPADYDPEIGPGGLPLRADGTPALVCAGWLARRRVLLSTPIPPEHGVPMADDLERP